MIGPQIRTDPYHVAIVRTPLTRNLGSRFDDIKDEISTGFRDLIPAKDDGIVGKSFSMLCHSDLLLEWTSVNVYRTFMQIICRTSNRLYVGLPLCKYQCDAPLISIERVVFRQKPRLYGAQPTVHYGCH